MSELKEPRPMLCRICRGAVGEPMSLRERWFGLDGSFEYWRCSACGTLQIVAVPEDLGRYYESYYSFGDDLTWKRRLVCAVSGTIFRLTGARVMTARLGLDAILDTLPRPPARVLDVGSGDGRLIQQLRWYGFECTGIDPFIGATHRTHGVELVKAEIWEAEGAYDVVMMHHSLEHMIDPHRVLAAAKRLLADDGMLLVRVPVLPNNVWDEFGDDWPQLDAPRHLFTFTVPALRLLAGEHGLVVSQLDYDATPWSLIAARAFKAGRKLADLGPADFVPTEEDNSLTQAANARSCGDQVQLVLRRAEREDDTISQTSQAG